MLVYEEYDTPAEKRAAQRGAKRGKPTGKARGYFFAFNEHGLNRYGGWGGIGTLFNCNPGATPAEAGSVSTSASKNYFSRYCRRVGAKHLPPLWRAVYERLVCL